MLILLSIAILVLSIQPVSAQTACSQRYRNPGVHICDPEPTTAASESVPEIFHLSAQANSAVGASINRYLVYMDGALVFQNRLVPSQERLSLELNLRAKITPGRHKLHLVVDSAGAADLEISSFRKLQNIGLCDPIGGANVRTCLPSSLTSPLRWKVLPGGGPANGFNFEEICTRYSRNLKNLEADIADAIAIDDTENLLLATHSANGIELRKYAPNGSIIFDSVLNMCADASPSVAAIAIGAEGKVWLAGNSRFSCLPVLPGNSIEQQKRLAQGVGERGFVVLFDTAKPSNTAPIYATHLSEAPTHISAIRAGNAGEAVVCGSTPSMNFPHSVYLRPNVRAAPAALHGFVGFIRRDSSGAVHSALFENLPIDALALGTRGKIYVAGGQYRPYVGQLSGDATRLEYELRFDEGAGPIRALAAVPNGSGVFIKGNSLTVAQPCKHPAAELLVSITGRSASDLPDIALSPTLDAFASKFSKVPLALSKSTAKVRQTCLID